MVIFPSFWCFLLVSAFSYFCVFFRLDLSWFLDPRLLAKHVKHNTKSLFSCFQKVVSFGELLPPKMNPTVEKPQILELRKTWAERERKVIRIARLHVAAVDEARRCVAESCFIRLKWLYEFSLSILRVFRGNILSNQTCCRCVFSKYSSRFSREHL